MVPQNRLAVWPLQVYVNLTFTSPQVPTDWDLMSRPAHYVTFDVWSSSATEHDVTVYVRQSARCCLACLYLTWGIDTVSEL